MEIEINNIKKGKIKIKDSAYPPPNPNQEKSRVSPPCIIEKIYLDWVEAKSYLLKIWTDKNINNIRTTIDANGDMNVVAIDYIAGCNNSSVELPSLDFSSINQYSIIIDENDHINKGHKSALIMLN